MTIRLRKPQRNRPYWRVFPVFNGAVDKSAGTYADNKTAARHETRAAAIANADKPAPKGLSPFSSVLMSIRVSVSWQPLTAARTTADDLL